MNLIRGQSSPHLASKVRFFRDLSGVILQRREEVAYEMFLFSIQYICSEQADMDAFSEYLDRLNGEDFQREQENLLTYFLFHFYLDDTLLDKNANRDLFRRLVFVLALYQFYRIFVAIFSCRQNETLSLENRALAISFLSRYFEHSPQEFRKKISAALAEHQSDDMGFLFQLIS